MGSVGRYIFRTTLGAFLIVLVSVTALMWMTQAMRNVDLLTSQGQTVLVFIGITGLIIPLLVMLIAPIALMIAAAHVLTKLSTDSELIVMSAAGMAPRQVFAPLLAVGLIVSLMVGVIAFYVSPKSLREARRWVTEVRAEVVSSKIEPGHFTAIEGGKLTVHVRERKANGQLAGVMVDDQRDPKERMTIVAEIGSILTTERGVFLILESGTAQRLEVGKRDPAIIRFSEYAFDLSRLSPGPSNITYSAPERFASELLNPPPDDPLVAEQSGSLRAEFHNRVTSIIYPMAFLVLTFAYLGAPRTTRQGRATALTTVILLAVALRGIGFFGALSGARTPAYLLLPYAALAFAIAMGAWGIARGLVIEPPSFIVNALNALTEGVGRRFAQARGQAS
jgi:lipopolysaccharide export system permease protein